MKDEELVQGWEHSSVHPVHPVTWGKTFFSKPFISISCLWVNNSEF